MRSISSSKISASGFPSIYVGSESIFVSLGIYLLAVVGHAGETAPEKVGWDALGAVSGDEDGYEALATGAMAAPQVPDVVDLIKVAEASESARGVPGRPP